MKIAAVLTLPFHKWVLADTVAALRAEGVEVEEVTHYPTHAHDWATDDVLVLLTLQHLRPDALLMADYPYEPFRRAAGGCPVFATRHSLAARGNTWDPEQAEADYLVSFGFWDEEMMAVRHLAPKRRVLRVGVPWASPLLLSQHCGRCSACDPGLSLSRIVLCQDCGNKRCPKALNHNRACSGSNEPGQVGGHQGQRIVAWCPTWNDWAPDVADQLASIEGVHIVYRPHYATAWRKPEALARARALGFEVDDPMRHPADLLLRADVLVGDVSGIVLLALAVPGARLPIIQVEPVGASGAQVELDGPEWRWRDRIGDRCPPDQVAASVRNELGIGVERTDDDGPNRKILCGVVFGALLREGESDPARALARAMIAELGGQGG